MGEDLSAKAFDLLHIIPADGMTRSEILKSRVGLSSKELDAILDALVSSGEVSVQHVKFKSGPGRKATVIRRVVDVKGEGQESRD